MKVTKPQTPKGGILLTMIITEIGKRIIGNLEKKLGEMIIGSYSFSDMATEIQESMNSLGISILEGMIKEYNEAIRESSGRKKSWHIVRRDERVIVTPMGGVAISRDYYKHKRTGHHAYLLDEALGLAKHDRIDQSLKIELVKRAESVSYEKASKHNRFAPVSKQTVLKCIREAGSLKVDPKELERRTVRYLYIEADEDHIAYQHENGGIAKLVYVHEGAVKNNKRTELQRKFHFASTLATPEELWTEVADYIYERYDVEALERIYISGDGASWIRSGTEYIPKSIFLLDRFHRNEYIKRAVGADEVGRHALNMALDAGDKRQTFTILKNVYEKAVADSQRKRILDTMKYFRNNWDGIDAVTRYPNVLGCSAEGHVSHVLSDRLSSRPMGWSRIGAEQMARLRAFVRNGGDIHSEIQKKRTERRSTLSRRTLEKIHKKLGFGFEKHDNIYILNNKKGSGIYSALKSLQQTRWQVI